eukprot:7927044-Pyramimonas_sp.AAC.1
MADEAPISVPGTVPGIPACAGFPSPSPSHPSPSRPSPSYQSASNKVRCTISDDRVLINDEATQRLSIVVTKGENNSKLYGACSVRINACTIFWTEV